MQVVAKTPRIDVRVEGKGMKAFLAIIKKSIPGVQIIDDDEAQDIDDWDYYKEIKSRVTPAKVLKIRRENAELTQAELAEKCGMAASNIALMETGRSDFVIECADKLAQTLGCSEGDFAL